MEVSEEGPHYSGTNLERSFLFQPCPYITHFSSELGQGKVGIWISDEDEHECRSPHLWTDHSYGSVQLLEARISIPYHYLMHGPRSHL